MQTTTHKRVRAIREDREGTTRTSTRNAIRAGRYDDLEVRMSSRVNRRATLEV